MSLSLDIFSVIIEELAAPLLFPLQERDLRAFNVNPWFRIQQRPETGIALAALKATCLTCKALVPFCQRELFATAKFEAQPTLQHKWRTFAMLKRRLQRSPHLAQYIRNLYFIHDSRDNSQSELISTVLSKLHNLQAVELGEGPFAKNTNWKQFPNSIASAMGNIVKLPSLRHLRIFRIHDIPPEIVLGASHLRRLFLSSCTFQPWPESLKTNTPIEPRTGPSQMIDPADPSFDRSGIRVLVVDIISKEDLQLVQNLAKVTEQLTHLKWMIPSNGQFLGVSSVLSAGISRTLTRLILSVRPETEMAIRATGYAGQAGYGLHTEIWRLPEQNLLQSFTIEFYHDYSIAFRNPEQFHEVDKALVSDRFPHLTQVQFHFAVHLIGRRRAVEDEMLERFRSMFPLLSSANHIDFQCSVKLTRS